MAKKRQNFAKNAIYFYVKNVSQVTMIYSIIITYQLYQMAQENKMLFQMMKNVKNIIKIIAAIVNHVKYHYVPFV